MNVLFGHLVSRQAKDRKIGHDSGSRSYMVAVAIATKLLGSIKKCALPLCLSCSGRGGES